MCFRWACVTCEFLSVSGLPLTFFTVVATHAVRSSKSIVLQPSPSAVCLTETGGTQFWDHDDLSSALLPPVEACRSQGLPHAARLLRTPPCGWRVAVGFPRGGSSLAPRRSKEAPKTGYHGGIIRQTQRNRFILTASAIRHARGEGYRALRAPASASVPSAGPQTPGAKSGGWLTAAEPRALQSLACAAGCPGGGLLR